MKAIKSALLFVALFILFSCDENDDISINSSEKLLGSWINPVYSDTIYTYERASALKDNNYGIAFNSDQSLVERKNAGWCGTPPIAYGDFEGSWSKNDSIINITVGYWGGTVDYQWKIIELNNTTLSVSIQKQEYNQEN